MRSALLKKFAGTVLIALAMLTLSATSAYATHFRYGTIVWSQTNPANPRVVTFQITSSWRRSYPGWYNLSGVFLSPNVNVGNVVSGLQAGLVFNFGDGASANMDMTVTSVDPTNDWFTGTFTVTHTYASSAPFTPYFFACCRLSPPATGNPDGMQNNTDTSFYVWTRVNTTLLNHPPTVSVPPIITLAANRTDANFPLSADDIDGNPLTYRLATQAEQCGPATLGPTCTSSLGTPVAQPTGLSVDSSGIVHFNTTSPRAAGQVWNAQIVVSDNTSSTVVDLLIRLVNQTSQPPVTLINGLATPATFVVKPTQAVTFTTSGTDPDAGAIVTITASGVPVGGSFATSLPDSGLAPRTNTFNWTPTLANAGFSYVVNIITTDTTGLQDFNTATIQVLNNIRPTAVCPTSPWIVPLNSSGVADVTVPVQVDDTDGDALSVLWKFGATLWDSVTVPANSGGTHAVVSLDKAGLTLGSYSTQITVSDNITTPITTCNLTVQVVKAPQTISFDPIPDHTYGDGPLTLVATASSGLPVTFSLLGGPASLVGDQLTLTGVGMVTVQASQLGDAIYDPAMSVIAFFNVGKATPTVSVTGGTFPYDALQHGATATATGVGGADLSAGVTITYDGSSTAPTDAGTYDVMATFPGNALYSAATATNTITIEKVDPIVTVSGGTFTFDADYHTATASATGVGGVLLFPVDVTYNGGVVMPFDAGTYAVQASYAGSTNYNPATATNTITIDKFDPIVTVTGGTFTFDDQYHPATDVSAKGVGGVDLNPVDVTYDGGIVLPGNAGIYAVLASYAGSTNYNPASASATIAIGKADPVMSVSGGTFTYDGDYHAATGSARDVHGADLSPVSITYDGTILLPGNVGSYAVEASYPGNANYNPGTATNTITIGKADPVMTVSGGTFTFDRASHAATASAKGAYGTDLGPVTVTYNGVAAVPVDAGTYAVLASYAGDGNYNPGTATNTITIDKATPIVVVSGGTFTYDALAHSATATASGVGSPAESLGPVTVTYNGSLTAPVGTGSYAVLASYAGNGNYIAVNATNTITIGNATPTVTVSGGTFTYNALAHPATATATGVGGAVGPVTVTYNGSPAAPVSAGTYTVLASYAGDANNNPASASNTLVINPAALTVTADNKSKLAGAANPPLTATFAGLQGSDTFTAVLTTTATTSSPAGTYPITVTHFTTSNYNVTYVNGTLTVTSQPNGLMYGAGHIDSSRTHNHFVFRVSQINNRDYGRLEFWQQVDSRNCRNDDDDYDEDHRGYGQRGDNDRDYGRDHNRPSAHFEATLISSVTFSDDPAFRPGPGRNEPTVDSVVIVGSGKWNGRSGYTFEARATDKGEPGRNRDTFSIVVKDSSGRVVANLSDTLDGGNNQSTRLPGRR